MNPSYLLFVDGIVVGYGSVKGKDSLTARDAVFEFYVSSPYRGLSSFIFHELITTSAATFIECQSNDINLSSMLYEFSKNSIADVILFDDGIATNHKIPNVIFRHRKDGDTIFKHTFEPIGDYVLEWEGEIVATGGFMLHYNLPFADLFMEVMKNKRRIGLGSFLIQELKKECYLSGRVPAARCNIDHTASKSTLIKAGMKVCGYMLTGELANQTRPLH